MITCDVIVFKNLPFHPSTRVQQSGLHRKNAFSVTVFTGRQAVGQTREKIFVQIKTDTCGGGGGVPNKVVDTKFTVCSITIINE